AVRRNAVLALVPRAILETAAVAGMVLVSLFAVISGRFQEELFPLLAVLAVATVRLVPSANRILQSWNGIRFHEPAIKIISAALLGTKARPEPRSRGDLGACLKERLSIRVERFAYQGGGEFGLRDVHIEIGRGESVALIGRSGSGKTTLVDLILGLFPDFEGEIKADGIDIRSLGDGWHRRIGYIPQSIYLSDDTVVRNVAFGVPEEEISLAQVKRALKLAGLEHVVEALPEGLETVVGDDGIRLSGGERQRIGIARALYHDPDLLVLDEATSALDNETEHKIVDAILGLTPAKTIIVVAHRLGTVGKCDCVYLMSEGQVIDSGGFERLAARHPEFVNPQSEESP
ncbi:MAG: ABC transporter ATP-binding protein, partial [Thermoanaerobaculia bacterium]